jgi:hypothetical protein
MALSSAIYGLWVASICLQTLLGIVLLAKKSWGKFPFFTSYALFNLCEVIACYLSRGNGTLYFRVWSSFESVSILLGLGVVYEIFHTIFVQHPALRRLASLLFAASVLLLLAVGGFVIWTKSPSGAKSMISAVLIVAEATRILEVGLLMFLFVFASAFGLHWRQATFGIALGLGICTAVELLSVTMQSEWGASGSVLLLNLGRMLAFNISLLIWIGYIVVPERAHVSEMPETAQLEQWNQALLELIHQ